MVSTLNNYHVNIIKNNYQVGKRFGAKSKSKTQVKKYFISDNKNIEVIAYFEAFREILLFIFEISNFCHKNLLAETFLDIFAKMDL